MRFSGGDYRKVGEVGFSRRVANPSLARWTTPTRLGRKMSKCSHDEQALLKESNVINGQRYSENELRRNYPAQLWKARSFARHSEDLGNPNPAQVWRAY
jgi:hypothetical protein